MYTELLRVYACETFERYMYLHTFALTLWEGTGGRGYRTGSCIGEIIVRLNGRGLA